MHFLTPQMWWLAPVALLGVGIAAIAWARQKQMTAAWGSTANLSRFANLISANCFKTKGALLFVALLSGVVALARPSLQNSQVEYPAGTVDLIVVLDVSRSMAARDCEGKSRIKTAKQIIREKILPVVKTNRIGVVTYSGDAATQAYLTDQILTIDWLAEHEMSIASAPGQGSAMGKAFKLAFDNFDTDSDPTRKKLIVLLSDGGTDDATKIEEIAAGAAKRDVDVIVVALGTTTPAQIPVQELSDQDRTTATGAFYKIDGKEVTTALEADFLAALAGRCGGNAVYLPVTSASQFDLAPLTAPLKPQTKIGENEIYFYPSLIFFIALCLASVVTRGKRFEPRRRSGGPKAKSGTKVLQTQGGRP